VKELGGKVVVFNMEDTGEEADFLFLGPCEELLPKALGLSDIVDSVRRSGSCIPEVGPET
jgi:NAD-dependent deacetylase sirtuin 5